ncbi:MAG: RHS repeat-associated core domain-containing protein [Myxococcales bacterium]
MSATATDWHGVSSGPFPLASSDLCANLWVSQTGWALTDSYTYNAFGELLEHVGFDPQPYMFAGEAWEGGTGLYYNRARWLDVGAGRFVSSDTFSGSSALPVSLHKYFYANANPLRYIDPTGKMSLGGMMAATSMLESLAMLASPDAGTAQGIAAPSSNPFAGVKWEVDASIPQFQQAVAAMKLISLDIGQQGATGKLRPESMIPDWANKSRKLHEAILSKTIKIKGWSDVWAASGGKRATAANTVYDTVFLTPAAGHTSIKLKGAPKDHDTIWDFDNIPIPGVGMTKIRSWVGLLAHELTHAGGYYYTEADYSNEDFANKVGVLVEERLAGPGTLPFTPEPYWTEPRPY